MISANFGKFRPELEPNWHELVRVGANRKKKRGQIGTSEGRRRIERGCRVHFATSVHHRSLMLVCKVTFAFETMESTSMISGVLVSVELNSNNLILGAVDSGFITKQPKKPAS